MSFGTSRRWRLLATIVCGLMLVALAIQGGSEWLKLLLFGAIVGMAAWGWGAETKVAVRERTADPDQQDLAAAEERISE